MKKFILISICFIAFVGLLYATWSKGRELRELRGQEEAFLNRHDETPIAIEQASTIPSDQTDASQTNTSHLLQLRGEIVRLELRKKDLISARAENDRLKVQMASIATNAGPELPADYVRASKAQDRGLATPQTTMETFFWAIQNTNAERLLQCFTPDGAARVESQGFLRHFLAGGQSTPGFRIARTNSESADFLSAQIEPVPGAAYSSIVTFRLINGEWKLDSL